MDPMQDIEQERYPQYHYFELSFVEKIIYEQMEKGGIELTNRQAENEILLRQLRLTKGSRPIFTKEGGRP